MPESAAQAGVSGTVKVQAKVRDGQIQDIQFLSGLPIFHGSVRDALSQYKCKSGQIETTATQEFQFQLVNTKEICPTIVLPVMPRWAVREMDAITVKAVFRIEGGEVKDVTFLSGSKSFHQAVRVAAKLYRCVNLPEPVLATQEFVFDPMGRPPKFRPRDASSALPIPEATYRGWGNKSFDQLSPSQKVEIQKQSIELKEGDEPPYPIDGVERIFDGIGEVADRMGVSGGLVLLIQVNSSGAATSVKILQAPQKEFAKYAAAVAMRGKYKPAICDGQPCAKDFRIDGELVR